MLWRHHLTTLQRVNCCVLKTLLMERFQKSKKTPITLGNSFSNALLMSLFQSCSWHCQKRTSCDLITELIAGLVLGQTFPKVFCFTVAHYTLQMWQTKTWSVFSISGMLLGPGPYPRQLQVLVRINFNFHWCMQRAFRKLPLWTLHNLMTIEMTIVWQLKTPLHIHYVHMHINIHIICMYISYTYKYTQIRAYTQINIHVHVHMLWI